MYAELAPFAYKRIRLTWMQITCLYDMDIPRPDNFNETYLYEG